MAINTWIGNYYVDSNGLWQQDRWIHNGKWWYRHGDGFYTKNDFEVINGQIYYFDQDGYMVTGWKSLNDTYYFFDASGAMAKNRWIGNYYLLGDGTMAKNQWIGSYYVGSDGCWR